MAEALPQAAEVKSCCVTAYSSDLVGLLLGDSYHPGGLALTRRVAAAVEMRPGQRVLDVAAGRGTSALLFAREYDVDVIGVDLAPANVALATGAAQAADLATRATFRVGDAEHLPLPDGSVDAIVCECALCIFPDKTAAAGEFARVLRPGGRVGLTDVTALQDQLPPELTTLGAWIACVTDARPAAQYAELFTDAGLRVTAIERHDAVVGRMIDQIEARLEFLRLTAHGKLEANGIVIDQAAPVLAAARTALADGLLGYSMLIAHKDPQDVGVQL